MKFKLSILQCSAHLVNVESLIAYFLTGGTAARRHQIV